VPAHPVARALILAAGVPVAAPSANLFSRPSPTSAAHVLNDLDGRIDAIIDGGTTTLGVESTVIDLSGPLPTVLRPGAITLAALRKVTNVAGGAHQHMETASLDADRASPSPGMLAKHYSPRAPLTLYIGADERAISRLIADARAMSNDGVGTIGILAPTDDLQHIPSHHRFLTADLGRRADLGTIAMRLYASLRELDAAGVDVILASDVPADEGLGAAIHDRLTRAAAGRIRR
jgi:L-threonylcarbamoyladenylate synthase